MSTIDCPMVYIVIVNYNNWQDTISCLECLVNQKYSNYCIILVDNYSTDDSVKFFKKWSDQQLCPFIPSNHPLKSLITNNKPLDYSQKISLIDPSQSNEYSNGIIFIKSNENRGFSGGNNLGLKYLHNYISSCFKCGLIINFKINIILSNCFRLILFKITPISDK